MLKVIRNLKFNGDLIITDPLYIVNHAKLEDSSSKPLKQSFYPKDWTPPTEEDYFNNTEKALLAKRCEQQYEAALSEWRETLPNDWDICNYGENMEHIGFCNYIYADTIYGPWSCTAFSRDNKVIGRFTSDSGLVAVFLLSEILKYSPKWDLHLSKPYCATMIPNFKGEVRIINVGGTSTSDCDVRVVGVGSSQFYTKQTGF